MGETQYAERLKAMATPPPGEPDTIEHEAIRWAIEQIEAARTPGPDVSLLKIVLDAAEMWSRHLVDVQGPDETLEAAIDAILAEHEAAHPA